jgi:glycosyltransferase involved in cell wall biosynthesis
MNIELSIIVPHFNDTEGLESLLNSIPNKPEIEIIVVDDCSNKKELKCFNEFKILYKERNIKFLHNNSKIKSAGKCRNIGVKIATGKWILFADADDYFVDGWFEIVEKHFSNKYDVVFFLPTSVNRYTHKLSKRHLYYSNLVINYNKDRNNINEILLRYKFFVPWSKLIKAEIIKKNNIEFEEVIASNDILFSTKISFYAKEINVDINSIYCVTTGLNSLTLNNDKVIFYARLNEFSKYKIFIITNLNRSDYRLIKWNGFGYVKLSFERRYGLFFTVKVFLKILYIHMKIVIIKYFF